MRLWHKDLISILPSQQLFGQWRECCLIARNIAVNKTPNHILVNRIMDYPIEHFMTYIHMVRWEMQHRGFSPSREASLTVEEYLDMPMQIYVDNDILFDGWHNDRYLWQCVSNLEEKYDCGGIPYEEWEVIDNYISEFL